MRWQAEGQEWKPQMQSPRVAIYWEKQCRNCYSEMQWSKAKRSKCWEDTEQGSLAQRRGGMFLKGIPKDRRNDGVDKRAMICNIYGESLDLKGLCVSDIYSLNSQVPCSRDR